MGLSFDLSNITDWKTLCYTKDEDGDTIINPMTDRIIWESMFIGMGTITEENYHRWYARSRMSDCLVPPHVSRRSVPITLDDVKAHIGLKTNVYEKETDRKYIFSVWKKLQERIEDEERREVKHAS